MLFANMDITEISLYMFFLFFFGLIIYLRREDRREGYPLEQDTNGKLEPIEGILWFATPKKFTLPHGRGMFAAPNAARDGKKGKSKRLAVWAGAPSIPDGDPFAAGVGPGSYADRSKAIDVTLHGDPKIVPLRAAPGYAVVGEDPNPVGWSVQGLDGASAGTVSDLWIDRSESLIRYVEVELGAAAGIHAGRRVLLPMTMAAVNKAAKTVETDAVTAAQFAGAPKLSTPDQITFDEEERVAAYFGAGYLYATRNRAEAAL